MARHTRTPLGYPFLKVPPKEDISTLLRADISTLVRHLIDFLRLRSGPGPISFAIAALNGPASRITEVYTPFWRELQPQIPVGIRAGKEEQ